MPVSVASCCDRRASVRSARKWTNTPSTPPSIARFPIHLSGPFQSLHRERHCRIARQAVQLGTVAVGEHRDHRRAADAGRIVDGRVREPVGLAAARRACWRCRASRPSSRTAGSWSDTPSRRRAAGRRRRGPRTACTCRRASVLRVNLRHVERAAGDAVAAADALVLLEVDDAVRRTGRWRRARGRRRDSPARRSACTGPCASATAARRSPRARGT